MAQHILAKGSMSLLLKSGYPDIYFITVTLCSTHDSVCKYEAYVFRTPHIFTALYVSSQPPPPLRKPLMTQEILGVQLSTTVLWGFKANYTDTVVNF